MLENKLNKALDDRTIKEVQELISITQSKSKFNSKQEFAKHLTEGSVIKVTKIASKELLIPSGQYIIDESQTSKTKLISTSRNKTYILPTAQITESWNKITRAISEEENVPNRIDMSTVDRTPLARALQDRGMTETELADICGVDTPAISRILRKPQDTEGDPGGRNPSMELASKICAALRLDPKAAFPDFFKVDSKHSARQQPANSGSGKNYGNSKK